MGRPSIDSALKKEIIAFFRVTKNENKKIIEEAKKLKLSKSEFLRLKVMKALDEEENR